MRQILVILGVILMFFVAGCATFNQGTSWPVSDNVTIGGGAILRF